MPFCLVGQHQHFAGTGLSKIAQYRVPRDHGLHVTALRKALAYVALELASVELRTQRGLWLSGLGTVLLH
jgi:hypothetical protein